jgi:cytochrome c biogenesis protein CcmG, thiol:disulfide interchange protein DsbE
VRRWLAAAPILVIVALVGLFALWSLHRQSQVIPTAMVGQPLPARSLAALDGGAPLALGGVRGPVLVNFFASWCTPCIAEAPVLAGLKAQGVKIIGVAYRDQPEAIRRFLARTGNPYSAVYIDPEGAAGVDIGLTGVPETYLVDAKGVIRIKEAQPLSPETAEKLAEKVQ